MSARHTGLRHHRRFERAATLRLAGGHAYRCTTRTPLAVCVHSHPVIERRGAGQAWVPSADRLSGTERTTRSVAGSDGRRQRTQVTSTSARTGHAWRWPQRLAELTATGPNSARIQQPRDLLALDAGHPAFRADAPIGWRAVGRVAQMIDDEPHLLRRPCCCASGWYGTSAKLSTTVGSTAVRRAARIRGSWIGAAAR